MSGYRIIEELGRGAMGVVYRAEQVDLRREVALKVLPRTVRGPDLLRRFRREVKVVCALSHPHIVHIYDGGELDERPYYAMEIISGLDLAHRMLDGPAPFADVLRWMDQGADALAYIHAQGLAHRDIKPGNLMVNAAGDLVVMDFGLAKDVTATVLTAEGAVVGTPRYIAPEGFRGQEPGMPQDVYALALCAHELLTGAAWESSKSLTELATRVLSGPPPTLAGHTGVPAWFVELQARALVPLPEERLTAAAYRDGLRARARSPTPRGIVRPSGGRSAPPPDALGSTPASGLAARSPLSTIPSTPVTPLSLPSASSARGLPVVALALSFFALGLAGFWLAHRPRPAAAPAAAPALESPTFPAHRAVAFAVRGAVPDGAQVVVRSAAGTWRGPPGAAITALPPDVNMEAELADGTRTLAGPLAFRTPAIEPLTDLVVQPTDVEVLVDFQLDHPLPVAVSIYRGDGQRVAHVEQEAGPEAFSHWFTGLRADTAYRLDVQFAGRWGGISGFAFHTENTGQSRSVRETAALIHAQPHMAEYYFGLALKTPDRRLIPALLSWLHSGDSTVSGQIRKVCWIAEKMRSRELADALLPYVGKNSDAAYDISILNLLATTRHPAAPEVARRLLPVTIEPDRMTVVVRGLSAVREPATVDLIEPALARSPEAVNALPWVIRASRPRAHELFRRWAVGPHDSAHSLSTLGFWGLAELRAPEDVPLLASLLKPGSENLWQRGFASHVLSIIDGPAAREAIERALAADPADQQLMWAAARMGLDSAAPHIAAVAADRRNPPGTRFDAICVAAQLAGPESEPTLLAALSDPDPLVQQAAAWGLSRAGSPAARAALAPLAAARGPASDAALFALGVLRDPAAAAAPSDPTDRSRAALAAWARSPGTQAIPVFPLAAYQRTGIHLYAGDCVRLSVSGTWRAGSAKDDVPEHTQPVGPARLSVHAWVGGQILELDRFPRVARIRAGGELLLTPWDPPPVHVGDSYHFDAHGLALVRVEP